MGFLSKVGKEVNRTFKNAGNAPKKVGRAGEVAFNQAGSSGKNVFEEIGRGVNSVANYPEKFTGNVEKIGVSALTSAGKGVGGAFNEAGSGIGNFLGKVTPYAKDLLATYLDPQGYNNRKQPFPSPDVQQNPPYPTQIISPENNKIIKIILIAIGIILIGYIGIKFFKKKKR